MKKAIITGANGFVGRALVNTLIAEGYEVFAILRCEQPFFTEKENINPVICDLQEISTLPQLVSQRDIPVFFHLAWAGSGKLSERVDIALQLEQIQGTVEAMKVAADLGCKKFIVSGSIMEEELSALVDDRQARPSMSYVYGAAKKAAHGFTLPLAVDLGIDLIWTQITNTYGVGEQSERLILSTLKKCIKRESLTFTAGTQNYDFIYIEDVARAFCAIAEKGIPFSSYVIGSGSPKPLKEFLLELQESVAPELEFVFGELPFTGVNLPLSAFDCRLLQEDTGFQPCVSFREGCVRTAGWLEREQGSDLLVNR